jgi:hypothetical protein
MTYLMRPPITNSMYNRTLVFWVGDSGGAQGRPPWAGARAHLVNTYVHYLYYTGSCNACRTVVVRIPLCFSICPITRAYGDAGEEI